MGNRIVYDDPYEKYSKKELKKRKKKVLKWYDKLTIKKEKRPSKNIQIEREDEI